MAFGIPISLAALHGMESTGGEPDVVGGADEDGRFKYVDCSPQSPASRRSICYDAEARRSRKEHAINSMDEVRATSTRVSIRGRGYHGAPGFAAEL